MAKGHRQPGNHQGGLRLSKGPLSPKMRAYRKREAEKDERKDRSRIKDPKASVGELFHGRTKI